MYSKFFCLRQTVKQQNSAILQENKLTLKGNQMAFFKGNTLKGNVVIGIS